MSLPAGGDAYAMAMAVRAGRASAGDTVRDALGRIAASNPRLNAFTHIFADSAVSDAHALDRRIAAGDDPGPLAGVPFAVKNLFDVEGHATVAGSKIRRDYPPAQRDATVVARLKAAG